MNLGSIAARNVLRNKARTLLTVFGVGVAILTFVLLRTVLDAWTVGLDAAAKDRIGTRHKVTFIMPLPKRYVDDIRSTPGVKSATWMNWFGGKDPKHDKEPFGTMAVEPASFLEVYDEIELPKDQAEAWQKDRQGAVVGDVLAKKLGWKVGDRVILQGTIYPGDWEFRVVGIYTAKRKSVDRSTFWFRWDYLNDSVPPRLQDQVGWVAARIDDAGRSAQISQEIDRKFEERDVQTVTMSERALQMSFMGMFSAVLKALNVISVVILFIMTLILGNTIAMGVRERTHEYGTLRAIGFMPRHLALFVVGEAITVGLLGGAVGLGLSYLLVNGGMGSAIEENMGGIFPYFRITTPTSVAAILLALVFSGVAAALPAYGVMRLKVTDSLRRIG